MAGISNQTTVKFVKKDANEDSKIILEDFLQTI